MIRLKSLLNEQKSDQLMPGQSDNPQFTGKVKAKQTTADLMRGAEKAADAMTGIGHHDALMVASIAVGFVPVIGPFISSGIMLADAAIYEKEGNDYQAGLTRVFAALPLVGPIARLGSGAIAKLSTWGMSKLGFKVATAAKGGTTTLTKLEAQAVQDLTKNNKFVRAELDKFLTNTAKQNSKKLSAWSMRKGAMSLATKEALKNPLTKVAATLGLYMGAADVYDYAYWRKYSVKPEQAKAMIDQTQQEILDESMQSLDRMIAAKKKNKQIARVEHAGSNKSAVNEAGIEKLNPTPWLDAISMDASTIMVGAAVIGGRMALNGLIQYSASMASKLGWTTLSTKLGGFRVPGFVKITDLLYRGIKALFVGRDKAFKGYRLFSVNVKDLEMILEKLKQHQIKEYELIHNYVATGKMTAEEAMTYYRNTSWASKLKPVEGQLQNKLTLLEKTAPPKNTSNRVTVTGYQQSSKNKTSKGQQGQKDLDKYFVPRNMSIDDYDKLNINTQAYIQRNNLDWTYDQALRWQKR